jgi:hypothetical protein
MPIQKRKITAGAVTTLILVLLLTAGPAQAFTLNLTADKKVAEQGKKITFTASIDTMSGERIPIKEIVLILDGPEKKECSFDVTGKMKPGINDPCHGINIKKHPPNKNKGYGYRYGYYHGYGYDFGYGYGTEDSLEYEITLHSQKFETGKYKSYLKIKAEGKEFQERGSDFQIKKKEKKQESSGGSPAGCLTTWECTEWEECKDGEQKRECEKAKSSCSIKKGDEKPEEKRSCEETEEQTIEANSQVVLETEENQQQTEQQPNSLSRVTGAAAGVTEKDVLDIIIVIVILAGMATVGLKLLVNRRRMNKFFSYKNYDFY